LVFDWFMLASSVDFGSAYLSCPRDIAKLETLKPLLASCAQSGFFRLFVKQLPGVKSFAIIHRESALPHQKL
jgi:hypothetical protein